MKVDWCDRRPIAFGRAARRSWGTVLGRVAFWLAFTAFWSGLLWQAWRG